MKEILNSVARYVELSREFTISSDEVYEDFKEHVNMGYLHISASGNVGSYNLLQNSNSSATLAPPKLEQYETALQEKYEKARRYEEYISLQKTLSEYFASVEKLKS